MTHDKDRDLTVAEKTLWHGACIRHPDKMYECAENSKVLLIRPGGGRRPPRAELGHAGGF
jgi:hypothetical protein